MINHKSALAAPPALKGAFKILLIYGKEYAD